MFQNNVPFSDMLALGTSSWENLLDHMSLMKLAGASLFFCSMLLLSLGTL